MIQVNDSVITVAPSDVDKDGVLRIPEGVVSIETRSIKNLIYLEKIIFPSTIEAINYSSIYCCENLRSIEFPDKGTAFTIHRFAIEGCPFLREIRIPENCTLTGNALANSHIKDIFYISSASMTKPESFVVYNMPVKIHDMTTRKTATILTASNAFPDEAKKKDIKMIIVEDVVECKNNNGTKTRIYSGPQFKGSMNARNKTPIYIIDSKEPGSIHDVGTYKKTLHRSYNSIKEAVAALNDSQI